MAVLFRALHDPGGIDPLRALFTLVDSVAGMDDFNSGPAWCLQLYPVTPPETLRAYTQIATRRGAGIPTDA